MSLSKKFVFSDHESEILSNLIDNYKHIIACKITNAHFNSKKEEAWEKLTTEFNAINGVRKRTKIQLQNKYKNMKKIAQKNKAADKVELYKTGGGGSMLKTTPMDEKFLAIGVVTNPLEEDIDCDSEYNNFIKDSQAQKENSSEAITFEFNRTEDVIDSEDDFHEQGLNETMAAEDFATPPTGSYVAPEISEDPVDEEEEDRVASSVLIKRVNVTSKKVPLTKKVLITPRRRPNASQKAAEAMVDGAQARKAAIESEALLRKEEHQAKMERDAKEHELKMDILKKEHELKMKIEFAKLRNQEQKYRMLVAKEEYFKSLTPNQS